MRELRGKVVVLTGASRGIGVSIAKALAAEGAHLVLAARDQAGLERVAEQVVGAGGQATVVACDIVAAADRQRLVDAALAVGPIEVLVNNAGVEVPLSVIDTTPEDVDRTVAVNLLAPIHLTRLVLPGMVQRRSGAVVVVSSMSGKSPTPYNATYTATKYGVNGFVGSLRIELLETGVHAGVVCPGFVADAGMWADTGDKAPALLPEVSLGAVVRGVRKVIDGAPEVLVTPGPVRPLLALGQLFPSLDGVLLRRMGILSVLEQRARTTQKRRTEPS